MSLFYQCDGCGETSSNPMAALHLKNRDAHYCEACRELPVIARLFGIQLAPATKGAES